MAVSPMLSGLLGATSIRAVFALDAIVMALLALWIRRTMVRRPPTVASEIDPTVVSAG